MAATVILKIRLERYIQMQRQYPTRFSIEKKKGPYGPLLFNRTYANLSLTGGHRLHAQANTPLLVDLEDFDPDPVTLGKLVTYIGYPFL